ncbi:TPA: LOW QUALITY PROTEIN: hypothetical protein N0F65_012526 [Lagenidium giganteum]|uniref:RGS domain-containing protein n=1 Tax=Lagenidium giganteum TaxID=4803 RepID=A0AAV2YIL8_9STRA|nr:TPA: LOW QUALITY PROTEIN: hypothetical protein N0F65_012526 [Lagenidium giganteum]
MAFAATMDTVRSDFSEESLNSSRFGGAAINMASLGQSFSGSIGSSRSTARSDFVNTFEQKFLERKAEKKKRQKDRERRTLAHGNQQPTIEQLRAAEREVERQARRKEMEAWLPTPTQLKQIERQGKKRSRQRMRELLGWYTYPEDTATPPDESNQNQAAAPSPSSSQADSGGESRPLGIKAIAGAAADRVYTTIALQGEIEQVKSQLAVLEELGRSRQAIRTEHAQPAHKALAVRGPRRRTVHSNQQLAPLTPPRKSSAGLRASVSNAELATLHARQAAARAHLGTSTSTPFVRTFGDDDDDADEAELAHFLARHRRQHKQGGAALTLQSCWRMYKCRRKYLRWRRHRWSHRRTIFEVWVLVHRINRRARLSLLRKYVRLWKDEVEVVISLRAIELKLFRDSVTQKELPTLVVNLVFTSSEHTIRSASALQAARARASVTAANAPKFFNSAYAAVEEAKLDVRGRVQQMRLMHMEARQAIIKRIVQRTFLIWKKEHQNNKRIGLNAQLCIKRAARLAFSKRPVWSGEKLMLIFEVWARWASFSRCKRLGIPMPHYSRSLPHWDVWQHNYQERQIRKIKAAAKSPLARMRRCFAAVKLYTSFASVKRAKNDLASHHYLQYLCCSVLLEWRAAIAESASNKKLLRRMLQRLRDYARVKIRLRPRKEKVKELFVHYRWRQTYRAWKSVQLRSAFRREMSLSRLEHWRWRGKVQRIIFIWMGVKSQDAKWKTFEAWRHYCSRRRLYLTLRVHCGKLRARHLLFAVFNAWKAVVWKQQEDFLEDHLQLSAWDAYKELSPLVPMLFYGCSIVEARNAVLRSKHLINAAEESTGNTALHVALEDSVQRIEVLTLLLSEGAASWHRKNVHGLTPRQLTDDADVRYLLDNGVYAYYSKDALRNARLCQTNVSRHLHTIHEDYSRLAWCMVTLMTSEWCRGLREGGALHREWHSVLVDEHWLRQERIFFASTSGHLPGIMRCRAFLNGMKRLLSQTTRDVHTMQWRQFTGRQGSGADTVATLTPRERDRRHILNLETQRIVMRDSTRVDAASVPLQWVIDPDESAPTSSATTSTSSTNDVSDVAFEELERDARAKQMGDLEGYARLLLTPTLDYEAVEKPLVHSYVGVLFSLNVPEDDVYEEGFSLQDFCDELEQRVLTYYHGAAEREATLWKQLTTQWPDVALAGVPGLPLLRYFADEADMVFHFELELFRIQMKEHRHLARTGEQSADEQMHAQLALQAQVESLLAYLKRRLRRMDKKKAKLDDTIAELEARYQKALWVTTKRTKNITRARMELEQARLTMAARLIKHADAEELLAHLEAMKEKLMTHTSDSTPRVDTPRSFRSADTSANAELSIKRAYMQMEYSKYQRWFHCLKQQQQQHAPTTNRERGSTPGPAAVTSVNEARVQFKQAMVALRALVVANSLRSCCFWLAEHMTMSSDVDLHHQQHDQPYNRKSDGLIDLPSRRGTNQLEPLGAGKRRSSIANTRSVIETLQRSSVYAELVEKEALMMKESYLSSAELLFPAERHEIRERNHQKAEAERKAVLTYTELNPITREPEKPPVHLVPLPTTARTPGLDVDAIATANCKTNRKREELKLAMLKYQADRQAHNDRLRDLVSDDGSATPSTFDVLPTICGLTFEFGNFASKTEASDVRMEAAVDDGADSDAAAADPEVVAAAERIWKGDRNYTGSRGMVRTGSTKTDLGAEEDTANLSASYRVYSASRDRRYLSRIRSLSISEDVSVPSTPSYDSATTAPSGIPSIEGMPGPRNGDGSVVLTDEDRRETPDYESITLGDSARELGEHTMDGVSAALYEMSEDGADAAVITDATEDTARPIGASSVDESAFFEDALHEYLIRIRHDTMQSRSAVDVLSLLQATVTESTPVLTSSTPNDATPSGTHRKAIRTLHSVQYSPPRSSGFPLVVQSLSRNESRPRPMEEDDLIEFSPFEIAHMKRMLHGRLPHARTHLPDTQMQLQGVAANMRDRQITPAQVAATAATTKSRATAAARTKKDKGKKATQAPAQSTVDDCSPRSAMREQTPVFAVHIRTTASADAQVVGPVEKRDSSPVKNSAVATKESSHAAIRVRQMELPNEEEDDADAYLVQLPHERPLKDEGKLVTKRRRPPGKPATTTPTFSTAPFRDHLQLDGSKMHTSSSEPVLGSKSELMASARTNASSPARAHDVHDPDLASKKAIWQSFTNAPVPAAVQNAYAEVYPGLYERTTDAGNVSPTGKATGMTDGKEGRGSLLRVRSMLDVHNPSQGEISRNKQFWKAVEGYKAIGRSGAVQHSDAVALERRRAKAREIFDEFINDLSSHQLDWIPMYADQASDVRHGLHAALPSLFDLLQQTAQLRISAAVAQRQRPDCNE